MTKGRWIGLMAGASSIFLTSGAAAATAEKSVFGEMPNGETVETVTLTGDNGVSVVLITLGATIQAFNAPDRDGNAADITIGYDTLEDYLERPNYWGQTIGRYANRFAGGRFTLDGRDYQVSQNDGENTLHGGAIGFDKRNWTLESVSDEDRATAVMTLRSADGDQGYPGNMDLQVVYSLDDAGALTIDFSATTDAPTIVNLTNHALFNLGGNGWPYGTYDQRLTIPASRYTPVDGGLIPTGEQRAVEGTVFDFRSGRMLWDGVRDAENGQIALGRGWDHNWVLDKARTARPELAARLEHDLSGRVLEVLSTEPGLQFYSGNFLDGTLAGKGNVLYRMGDGIALEPQLFPNTPNQPEFGSARLNPGETYRHTMIYRVSIKNN